MSDLTLIVLSRAVEAAQVEVKSNHWLICDSSRRVVSCHCGFPSDEDDCGYGDSILLHVAAVAATAAARVLRAQATEATS